jgi:hypothetical protein
MKSPGKSLRRLTTSGLIHDKAIARRVCRVARRAAGMAKSLHSSQFALRNAVRNIPGVPIDRKFLLSKSLCY